MNHSAITKTRLIAVLPTSLTLANAVCGFAAISYAMLATEEMAATQSLQYAGVLILAALVFDAFDGSVARLTRQTSAFGAELDSLCDLISFGVAPAIIIIQFPHALPERVLWCIALSFVLCAALRLARFNAHDESEHAGDWFIGLPSPAAGGVIASVAVVWPSVLTFSSAEAAPDVQAAVELLVSLTPLVVPWLTLLLACLMVSKIPYPHLMKQLLQGKRPLMHLVQGYFVLVAIFAVHEVALPLVFLFFALGSPLRAVAYPLKIGMERLKPHVTTGE